MLEPKIVNLKDPIKIIGITTRTTMENAGRGITQLGNLYMKEDISAKISNRKALGIYYGISIDFKDDETRIPPLVGLNRHFIQQNQTERV